jgi:hygromycin-B 7''-O-kinase
VENAVAADPLLDLAKTDYYAIHGDDGKRAAFLAGHAEGGGGDMSEEHRELYALYRLYHALELWDWFASTGQPEPLSGITEDMKRMVGHHSY